MGMLTSFENKIEPAFGFILSSTKVDIVTTSGTSCFLSRKLLTIRHLAWFCTPLVYLRNRGEGNYRTMSSETDRDELIRDSQHCFCFLVRLCLDRQPSSNNNKIYIRTEALHLCISHKYDNPEVIDANDRDPFAEESIVRKLTAPSRWMHGVINWCNANRARLRGDFHYRRMRSPCERGVCYFIGVVLFTELIQRWMRYEAKVRHIPSLRVRRRRNPSFLPCC